ncbi:hypothetical protein ACROYT_G042825 [Oculina patagonica]
MAPQIVLISGCSSGIGLATAVFLAKDDEKRFKVYATMRNLAKKGQLEEEGKEYLGDTLIIKQMDVCSDESVEKAVKEVLDTEGRIDVLFNNAGVGGLFTVLECTPIALAKELFEVNYFGTLRLIQAVLPSMKAKQKGHIINNSSLLGVYGVPFNELYCSTKFAMEGLTEALAPTLLHFNIRCSILEPGPVATTAFENSKSWLTKFNILEADKKSQELLETFSGRMLSFFTRTMQTTYEVAEVVKSIILSDKPNLRFQTNTKHKAAELEAKLADPTGNASIEIVKKTFLDPE